MREKLMKKRKTTTATMKEFKDIVHCRGNTCRAKTHYLK